MENLINLISLRSISFAAGHLRIIEKAKVTKKQITVWLRVKQNTKNSNTFQLDKTYQNRSGRLIYLFKSDRSKWQKGMQ